MRLGSFRGAIAITGQHIDNIANQYLDTSVKMYIKPIGCPFHVTFCSKDELHKLKGADIESILDRQITPDDIIAIKAELKRQKGTAFIKILWNKGNMIRKQFGLHSKDFHITLNALHLNEDDINRSISAADLSSETDEKCLDHFLFHSIHIKHHFSEAKTFCEAHLTANLTSHKVAIRMAEACLKLQQFKICSLICVWMLMCLRHSEQEALLCSMLRRCSKKTQISHVLLLNESADFESLPQEIQTEIYDSLYPLFRPARFLNALELPLLEDANELVRSHQKFKGHELPRYFSWVVPFFFAVASQPRSDVDIKCFDEIGIRHVITLTAENELDSAWFEGRQIQNTYLPIKNMQRPSLRQADYFIALCQKFTQTKEPFLIQCGGSKGRAGTLAACYLMLYRTHLPSNEDFIAPRMSSAEALKLIRQMRPGSVESDDQLDFLQDWSSHRWKEASTRIPEPAAAPLVCLGEGGDASLIILVGLAGSGKSSWATRFLKHDSNALVINQDESKDKKDCFRQFEQGIRQNRLIIVDRCNLTKEQRKEWLQLVPHKKAIVVWFSFDSDICKQRIANRWDHPTIKGGGRRIIEDQEKQMQHVSLDEGLRKILIVRSSHASLQAIDNLLVNYPFYKFPRTRHFINFGAATNDDIIISASDRDALWSTHSSSVVFEEKIDGANLGISLSGFDMQLQTQNRGHYVTSQSHPQFKKLPDWLDRNRSDLIDILNRDRDFPRRYILFGEWLANVHSIKYRYLPDRFIAFDLFDRQTKKFASHAQLLCTLAGTKICQVPLLDLPINQTSTFQEIEKSLKTRSRFYDGPIEGVYFRFEDADHLFTLSRAKIVRSDFLTSSNHWTSNKLQDNGISDWR